MLYIIYIYILLYRVSQTDRAITLFGVIILPKYKRQNELIFGKTKSLSPLPASFSRECVFCCLNFKGSSVVQIKWWHGWFGTLCIYFLFCIYLLYIVIYIVSSTVNDNIYFLKIIQITGFKNIPFGICNEINNFY